MESSWIERINIVEVSVLPNVICSVIAIPIKIPKAFFSKNREKKS